MQVAQLVILNFFFATGYQSIVRNAVCLVQLADQKFDLFNKATESKKY
ncbi:hypothetical protein KHDHEBDM_04354 [Pectobacterium polaris]|nr:hypothetical protein KHDHEBDM_04354 [Pectobacterium polaris]